MNCKKIGFIDILKLQAEVRRSYFSVVDIRGHVQINGGIVNILESSLVCKSLNAMEGLTGCVTFNDGKYYIFLSEEFNPDNRHHMAIVQHEVGHILHRHIEVKGFVQWVRRMMNLERNELEADAYAAQQGYAEPLAEVLESYYAAKPSCSLKRRIKALKSKGV